MRKAIPHIIAVIVFLIISLVYFKPALEGKTLVGHDTEGWIGMSKETRDFNATHENGTLWTNSMFGGMPTYQIAKPKSHDLLTIAVGDTIYKLPRVIYTLFLYLVGFYILMLCLGLNPWLSMAVASAFAFCSYNFIILAVGHDTKALSIAYMPAVIGSVIYAFRRNRYIGSVLTAIFVALFIRAGHYQIIYYTIFALILYAISETIIAVRKGTFKQLLPTAGLLIASALVAVGLNAESLMTTKEYSKETMRGHTNGLTVDATSKSEGLDKDYITGWSYGIGETMTLMIPNARGGASQEMLDAEKSHTAVKLGETYGNEAKQVLREQPLPTYWGTQPFTAGPVYAGAIVCFLALLGLLIADGRDKWWLLGTLILGLLMSWGHNFALFTNFLIDYVPLYNMFRTVSMSLVIACMALAALAGLALKNWLYPVEGTKAADEKWRRKSLYIAGGVTGGICLILWLIPGIAGDFQSKIDAQMVAGGYPSFLPDTLMADRKDMLSSDAFRSLIFIALSFVLLLMTKTDADERKDSKKFGVPVKWSMAVIAILILSDLVPVCKRYLNDSMFETHPVADNYFQPSYADQVAMADKDEHRVLDLTTDIFNSSRPSFFHHSVGGYHAAKLRRYQELINVHLNREISNIIATFQAAQSAKTAEEQNLMLMRTLAQNQVLNMLNTKYIIYNPNSQPLMNPFANGAAWLVNQAIIAETPDEEMLALGHMDTKTTLVADKMFKDEIPSQFVNKRGIAHVTDSAATIKLDSYAPNHLTYSYSATKPSLAVFSEIYYKDGWNAYVDGKEAEYFRANYLLRAMPLPAGQHKIEFKFEPKTHEIGCDIMIASGIILVVAIVVLVVFYVRRSKKETTENQ